MNKTALVCGVTGQTGAYLAHYLLQRGFTVVGSSRDASSCDTSRLIALDILDKITIVSLSPVDLTSVLQVVRTYKPDHIYYLAGQTSVGLSFSQPFEAFESIAVSTLNFLEVLRLLDYPCRFFNAGSTECFGDSNGSIVHEGSQMKPVSPYAVAKATSFWMTENYRRSYGLFACTGLLSNHESPLRPARFVTSKIVNSIHAIKRQDQKYLTLGNVSVSRDWGWAPDYVDAIYKMATAGSPDDYIIATGETRRLIDLIDSLCQLAGLDSANILRVDNALFRPSDLSSVTLSSQKIQDVLGWRPSVSFSTLTEKLYLRSLF